MNLRRYITYPHVVSSLALFVALGGSAYAVTQIDPNSVGTAQLKANAVKSSKIADGTVKRKDVRQGAFATPQQLVGINAAKLGGIGPGGFEKGNGSAVEADYDVNVDDVALTVPGGGQITVQCGTTGYWTYFEPTSGSWDWYTFRYVDQDATPLIFRGAGAGTFTKQEALLVIDAKSATGPSARLTIFAHFDDTTDRCIGRVRGTTYPN